MTLLELMLVIVVVGVMASMLITSAGRVRAYSFSARNQQHLMQLGMVMAQYTDEQGSYPTFGFEVNGFDVQVQAFPTSETGFDAFVSSLFMAPHHLGQVDVDGNAISKPVPVLRADGSPDTINVSYGYNIELVRKAIRSGRMRNPGSVAVFYDGSMSGPANGGLIAGNYEDNGTLDAAKWLEHSADLDRNGKRLETDVLFADGHTSHLMVEPEHLSVQTVR